MIQSRKSPISPWAFRKRHLNHDRMNVANRNKLSWQVWLWQPTYPAWLIVNSPTPKLERLVMNKKQKYKSILFSSFVCFLKNTFLFETFLFHTVCLCVCLCCRSFHPRPQSQLKCSDLRFCWLARVSSALGIRFHPCAITYSVLDHVLVNGLQQSLK